MPLPWKKNKVSRFSRIVADLQSPKRGNSLVVETGFPTSLVDLFVKNRERLKKPGAKKRRKREKKVEEEVEELVISDPIPLSNSRDLVPLPRPIHNLENMQSFDVCELVSELLPVLDVDEGVDHVDDVGVNNNERCWNEKKKRLLFVGLKMFLVVFLGLSTKKLVVGLTMSAFVLIFLEYFGRHVLCFLKPCLDAERALGAFVRGNPSSAFSTTKGEKKCEESRSVLIIQEVEQEEDCGGIDSCDLIDQIQILESNFHMLTQVEEHAGTESEAELLCCELRKREVEVVQEDGRRVLVCEKELSRNSKIRRKIIKKLVPKKLRGGKRWKKSKETEPDLSSETSSCRGDDELGRIEEEQENGNKQDVENKGKTLLSDLLELVVEEEDDGEHMDRHKDAPHQGVSSSGTGWRAQGEKVAVVEEGKTERKGCSDCLILFLAALIGLAGGQFVSLVLTLGSCLMIKFVRRCRCVNESVKRSSAQSQARIMGDVLLN